MVKRKASEIDDDDRHPPSSGPLSVGQQTSHIGNKMVRSERYQKLKHEKKKQKKIVRKKKQRELAKAEELGLPAPAKQVPKVYHKHIDTCLSAGTFHSFMSDAV